MPFRVRTVVCVLLLAITGDAIAAGARREPTFVSTGWLSGHLRDANLVVLHASNQRADFDAGHVPGARFLGWATFVGPRDSLSSEMPAEARFDSLLEAAGVRDDSRLVITGGPVTVMSRLFVTLEHFGLGDRTSMLNGGIDAWREEGRTVSRDSTLAAKGDVTLRPAPERVVDAEWIAAHGKGVSPGVAVVDARTPEYFQGLASNSNPRSGRLPVAGNVPYTWLTEELGRFRDRDDMEKLFSRAGVKRGDHVVTYCHIGIQACVAYVAARSLGYEVSMYDGSFEDWSKRSALPVESGPADPPR